MPSETQKMYRHSTSDLALKAWALGLLASKKDMLVNMLNAINALCVAVLPILPVLIIKAGELNPMPEQGNNSSDNNNLNNYTRNSNSSKNRSGNNRPLLSRNSTYCLWNGMRSTSHPWTRFNICPQIQLQRRVVSSQTPDRFRRQVAKWKKFMGPKYVDFLKGTSILFTCNRRQIIIHYSESTTALAWTQSLVSTPPSALIIGYRGYFYLSKLHHHLGGDAQRTSQTRPTNALTMFIHSQSIRDFTGFINLLLFCVLIFCKFIIKH